MNEDRLIEILKNGTRDELDSFCNENNLEIKNGKIVWKGHQEIADERFKYLDKQQLVRKILLNSLYGSLLNSASRFFDHRLGQSTTLTGRCIARHMGSETNRVIEGSYDLKGPSIVYGDTDSVYFSAYPILKDQIESGEVNWEKDDVISYYDAIGDAVNDTFPQYMKDHHNCPENYGRIIAAGREVVGETGLFLTKKRYGVMVIDDEGTRMDIDGKPGKLKVLGLEIKRSDTPVYMQDFLSSLLTDVLTGKDEEFVLDKIRKFRATYREMEPWEQGTPKRVNNLTNHTKNWKKTGKCSVGHVLAAINYNRLRDMYGDRYSMEITDGMKTIVCALKPNAYGMKAVGIPTDEKRIPDWFRELPFDLKAMEEKIVTKKIENLLGVLGWDLNLAEEKTTFGSLFDFD